MGRAGLSAIPYLMCRRFLFRCVDTASVVIHERLLSPVWGLIVAKSISFEMGDRRLSEVVDVGWKNSMTGLG